MTISAMREVVELLEATGTSNLIGYRVEHPNPNGGTDPTIEIRFDTLAALEAFAKADRAKVAPREDRRHLGHLLWHAMYERPGRRMLLQFYAFPHSPEWEPVR